MSEKSQDDRELDWLFGQDTGISSLTIFSVLSERHGGRPPAYGPRPPQDPDDLGRCLRLLVAIPEWRSRLPEVAAAYLEWAPLVRDWHRIAALYYEELPARKAPKCYAAMRELIEEGKTARVSA